MHIILLFYSLSIFSLSLRKAKKPAICNPLVSLIIHSVLQANKTDVYMLFSWKQDDENDEDDYGAASLCRFLVRRSMANRIYVHM